MVIINILITSMFIGYINVLDIISDKTEIDLSRHICGSGGDFAQNCIMGNWKGSKEILWS